MKISEILHHAANLVEKQEELIQQHEERLQYQEENINILEKENKVLTSRVDLLQKKEYDLEQQLSELGKLFQSAASILINDRNL